MSVLPIESTTRPCRQTVVAEPGAADPILISVHEVAMATTANLGTPLARPRWWRRLAVLLVRQDAAAVPATTQRRSVSYIPPLRPEYMEKAAMLREMRRL